MSAPVDYYAVLGIPRAADGKTIKSAYRRLALECHPDRVRDDPTAADLFTALSDAYETLSDASRRAKYDRGDDVGFFGAGAARAVAQHTIQRRIFDHVRRAHRAHDITKKEDVRT